MSDWKIDTSLTYKTFRPILLIMQFFGLTRFVPLNKKTIIPQIMFPFCVICLWLMQLARTVWCLVGAENEMNSNNLALYIVLGLGSSVGLLGTLSGLFISPKRLKFVLQKCDNLRQNQTFSVPYNKLRKRIIGMVLAFGFFLIAIVTMNLYSTQDLSLCLQSPIKIHKKESFLYYFNHLSMFLGSVLLVAYRIIAVILIHAMCYIPSQEFQKCNEEFKKISDTPESALEIETIRKRYFEICDLTEKIDNFLLPFLSLQIASVFSCICFFIHVFVFGILNKNIISLCVMIVVLFVVELTFMLFHGIVINEKSKKCLAIATQVDGTKMNTASLSTLIVFIQNMRSTDIGLTFLKLFILDKAAFITVFGSLLSFIIVTIQFQPISS